MLMAYWEAAIFRLIPSLNSMVADQVLEGVAMETARVSVTYLEVKGCVS